jgi:parvulin-like peptidyl-prolyl isomerase
LCVIIGIGAGLVFWKQKVGGNHGGDFSGLNKEEMTLLFKDANPMAIKRLADDPEMKKKQIENLQQLFAIASEADKDPSVNDKTTREALQLIDKIIWAQSYDREINKDKGPMPPFGFITEEQIKAFYGEGEEQSGGFFGNATARKHEAEFDRFVKIQIDFAKKNKAAAEDAEPNEEELKEMRSTFAKIMIYYDEAKSKAASGELSEEFVKKTDLQAKLQKAQFLNGLYKDVLAKKVEVTDADVDKYIAERPEMNVSAEKKKKAEEILQRVKNGEDFAALAKEFSEDPGSKDKGGLYEGIVAKQFVPEFEVAALALNPGEITQNLVETNYGYHIIKLEKKGETKDQQGQVTPSYDARHILISTMYKDPENPMAREMPVKDFARQKLESEKEKLVLDEIIARNQVVIAEDFELPQVTDEQIQEMMNKQREMQMQQMQTPPNPEIDGDKKPEPKKPEPKKK